jgi:hypothetical protein
MDKRAREQYMKTLREEYLSSNKENKGRILDEYCKNTGQERKYVIKKFRYKVKLKEVRKNRKTYYGGDVIAVLVKIWEIFDYPCGQRLITNIREEVDKLRHLGEIVCSDEVIMKLKKITSSTIDLKLEHEKHVILEKNKYKKNRNPLLCQMVPIKIASELDRNKPGVIGLDCVEHCGSNTSGEYVLTLATTDIFSGWWEGEVVMGKGQERALTAINEVHSRYPCNWKEVHPDNGGNILNYHVYNWAEEKGIEYSRSRPYKKNDNCFIEQKNSTHVRKVVGYLRYDTKEEMEIMRDLYRNELRLFKNFFQPTIKLIQKIRINGKIHKKYDTAKTPYKRIMESSEVCDEKKVELKRIYDSLNPAELKRKIDKKLLNLYKVHQKKNGLSVDENQINNKRILPSMVSFYPRQTKEVRCLN